MRELKTYLRLIFIWCPIVSVLFTAGFSGLDDFPSRIAISMTIAVTAGTFCYFGSRLVKGLIDFVKRRRGLPVAATSFVWAVAISYPFLIPGLYFGFYLAGRLSVLLGRPWDSPEFTDYSSGLVFGLMVSGFFALFEVVRESKMAKQAAELKFQTLENEKLRAQVSALAAQMNPHLMFNALNAIASTISLDPKSAEEMVVKLSELYRGVLKSARGDMHSLDDELDLCRSYLEIEKMRFGPRLEYSISVDPQVTPRSLSIPVLLIQPLVENAVKHGLAPKTEGGFIAIDVRRDDFRLTVSVRDNGIGIKAKNMTGTGTGLANCEARIKLKYGEASQFRFVNGSNTETVAEFSIPLSEVGHG